MSSQVAGDKPSKARKTTGWRCGGPGRASGTPTERTSVTRTADLRDVRRGRPRIAKTTWALQPGRDSPHSSGQEPGWPALRDVGYPQGLLQISEPAKPAARALPLRALWALVWRTHVRVHRPTGSPFRPLRSPAGSQHDLWIYKPHGLTYLLRARDSHGAPSNSRLLALPPPHGHPASVGPWHWLYPLPRAPIQTLTRVPRLRDPPCRTKRPR